MNQLLPIIMVYCFVTLIIGVKATYFANSADFLDDQSQILTSVSIGRKFYQIMRDYYGNDLTNENLRNAISWATGHDRREIDREYRLSYREKYSRFGKLLLRILDLDVIEYDEKEYCHKNLSKCVNLLLKYAKQAEV